MRGNEPCMLRCAMMCCARDMVDQDEIIRKVGYESVTTAPPLRPEQSLLTRGSNTGEQALKQP